MSAYCQQGNIFKSWVSDHQWNISTERANTAISFTYRVVVWSSTCQFPRSASLWLQRSGWIKNVCILHQNAAKSEHKISAFADQILHYYENKYHNRLPHSMCNHLCMKIWSKNCTKPATKKSKNYATSARKKPKMVFAVKTENSPWYFLRKNTRNAGVFFAKKYLMPATRHKRCRLMQRCRPMPFRVQPMVNVGTTPKPAAHLPWLLWWLPDLIPSSHWGPTQWCGFINLIVCSKFVRYSFTDLIQHYNEINCHRCGDRETDLICHRKTKRDLFWDLSSSRVGYTFM